MVRIDQKYAPELIVRLGGAAHRSQHQGTQEHASNEQLPSRRPGRKAIDFLERVQRAALRTSMVAFEVLQLRALDLSGELFGQPRRRRPEALKQLIRVEEIRAGAGRQRRGERL